MTDNNPTRLQRLAYRKPADVLEPDQLVLVNGDEAHIRAMLALIRQYPNVIDYELLPYHRYGESKYEFLGRVYELKDFTSPTTESLQRLQALIDEAFGRTGKPVEG